MTTFYVYRCYDADDQLVYVGQTGNVEQRMKAHRHGKVGALMARYEVAGPYPTRDAALTAEARAIAAEKPLINRRCNIERLYDEPTFEDMKAAIDGLTRAEVERVRAEVAA